MSAGELVEVFLEEYGFTFTVVRLPKEAILDKLALASPNTGIITKTEYQNFVFCETVLNLERIFTFMTEAVSTNIEAYLKLKDQVIDLSYEVNPGLDPNILAITKNGIIKPAVLCSDCTPLTSNPDWNRLPEAFNPFIDIDIAEIMDDIDEYNLEEAPPSLFSDLDPHPHKETEIKKWERTGLELEIKKYGKEDLQEIVAPTLTFPEEDAVYKVYIIQQTVVNSEHLFLLIESMNLTDSVPIETITQELYSICIEVNPFLKLEEIDLKDLRKMKPSKVSTKKTRRRRTIKRGTSKPKEGNDENSKSFSDVTKTELLTLADRIKEKVIGQDESIDKIVETVQIASCGLRDPEKPVAVYMLCGTTGVGKCHGKGTVVRMFDGSTKKVEDVRVGELLMGDDSKPREVSSLARGSDEMYKVVPVKGESFTCNKAHILSLKHTTTGEVVNISIEDYLNTNKNFKHLHKLYRVPVEYPSKEVTLDPYFVGLWLGDGNRKDTGITTADSEIIDYIYSVAASENLKVRKNELKDNASDTYFITTDNVGYHGKNKVLNKLRSYGLATTSARKFIPQEYLINSREVRLNLLAGLIDSDGHNINNTYEFVSKDEELAENIVELARSLGFGATIRDKDVNGAVYKRVFISGNIKEVPVKLPRKRGAVRKQIKNVLRTGFSIEPLGEGDYYGFTITGNHLYLLNDFTVTHNTLAAKVLAEELCGDRNAIVRIDCSEYTQQHDTQKLIGAPPSFVGHDDGGFLTNAVQKNPFSIVLFDEIEKAHSKFFDVLLQIMDDSRLTDGKGVVTCFKDCVILLTSNIGVAESESVKSTMGFGDAAVMTEEKQADALNKALKKRFRPEFLNRVDSVVNFKSLDKKNALKISGLLLDKVSTYLKNKDIKATFSKSVEEMVFDKGFSKKFGARPLERTIDREVVKPLAQKILLDEISDGDTIEIDYVDGEITVTVKIAETLTESN
jgi:hypothetical protein